MPLATDKTDMGRGAQMGNWGEVRAGVVTAVVIWLIILTGVALIFF